MSLTESKKVPPKLIKELAKNYNVDLKIGGLKYWTNATETELEHANTMKTFFPELTDTNLKEIAFRIAMDHIKENPRYYDILLEAGL